MRVRLRVMGILALGVLVGVVGMAQVTEDATAQLTVPTLMRLTLSGSVVDFGTMAEGDYDARGKTLQAAQSIQISSNVSWALTVAAGAATWTGPWDKPSTDLKWAAQTSDQRITSHVSTLTELTTGGTQVAVGTKGGEIALSMDLRFVVSWDNDPPGSYSLVFTYTLTSP